MLIFGSPTLLPLLITSQSDYQAQILYSYAHVPPLWVSKSISLWPALYCCILKCILYPASKHIVSSAVSSAASCCKQCYTGTVTNAQPLLRQTPICERSLQCSILAQLCSGSTANITLHTVNGLCSSVPHTIDHHQHQAPGVVPCSPHTWHLPTSTLLQ